MMCHDAIPWLLATRAEEALSAELSAHLSACPACGALRRRLAGLDERVRATARPPVPASLSRLSRSLEASPRPRPPARPLGSPSRSGRVKDRRKTAAVSIAAAVLVAAGWFSGRYGGGSRPEASRTVPAGPQTVRVEPFSVRMSGRISELSYSPSKPERLDVLKAIADMVRSEAVRLATSGLTEDASRLLGIHQMLLGPGLAAQIAALPAPERSAVAKRIARSLRGDEASLLTAEERMPEAVVAALKPFRDSVAVTADNLEGNPAAKPAVAVPGSGQLEALTLLAVRLAETDAPLQRADLSADLANALAAMTVLLAVGPDGDAVDKLSEYLEAVLTRGVGENLLRAAAHDPDGKSNASIESIRMKSDRSIELLDRNAAVADPQVRKGLERAAQVSRAGGGRWNADRKGPPAAGRPIWNRPEGSWIPPGQGGIPPGQQKKS